MKWLFSGLAAAMVSYCAMTAAATAASLQVAPVLLDVAAPGAATSATVRNTGNKPINVQFRVFRWVQRDGQERLEPTDAVVASPPSLQLPAGQDYLVRIVRTASNPVQGEEDYRLVIDELPAAPRRTGTVAVVVRHVVPLFFHQGDLGPADVEWSLLRGPHSYVLQGRNRGETYMRAASITVADGAGRSLPFGRGLLGYVLPGSTMQWPSGIPARGFAPGATVTVRGQSQIGDLKASASVKVRR
ncbi:fimbrial biogenesis chaperone [Pararhizobium sp. LjRoot238]|uniref:fimbrial biogenesis chaperone n=1 Tax=Pararhizobium sp. LjRoot238 TaxID=3342293 RepID=UPI003ED06F04